MHINRTNLVIVVGGVVVDSLVGIATGGVKCDFILSVSNLTTASLLVNRPQDMKELALSLSLSPETEFSFVNATFAKRDADERSPGSPIAPIPRLYAVRSALLPKLFSGCFGESDI